MCLNTYNVQLNLNIIKKSEVLNTYNVGVKLI